MFLIFFGTQRKTINLTITIDLGSSFRLKFNWLEILMGLLI